MATEIEACRFLDSEIGMCNYYKPFSQGNYVVFRTWGAPQEQIITSPYASRYELSKCPCDDDSLWRLFHCSACRKRFEYGRRGEVAMVQCGRVVDRYCSKACAGAYAIVTRPSDEGLQTKEALPYQVPPEYQDAWQTAYKTFALGVEGIIASSSLSTTPLKQVLAEADILGRERLIELTMRKWADGGGAMTRWFAERYVDGLAVEIGEKAAERLAKCAGWWTESDRGMR